MYTKFCLILFITYICCALGTNETKCPESNSYVRRLGKTKYYVLHGLNRGNFVSKDEAKIVCENEGLRLATVRNLVSMALLGRELEKLGLHHKLRDTWYWIDAVYDNTTQSYFWGDPEDGDIVKYSNILFRPPRPIGVGGHINYKGVYQKDLPLEQCLTLALPLPWPNGNGSVFGFQTMFDERYCKSKTSRHALCEATNEKCALKPESPFHFSEDKIPYFEDGNWIFGDRKYILSWKHHTYNETEHYCDYLGLNVLTPGTAEKWLIPHIKLWSRSITTSLFWTSLRYNATSMQFINNDGKPVANSTYQVSFTENSKVFHGRSFKDDTLFCVALSLSYEFKSQMPCPKTDKVNCTWSFINYVPSNCENYHASICQHKDHAKTSILNELTGNISWENFDPKNLTLSLQNNAVTLFGLSRDDYGVYRSKVKQTFGLCYCPKNFRMMRQNDRSKDWGNKPKTGAQVFTYDYMESYWILDEDGFNKTASSNCTVSYVESDRIFERKLKQVRCTEWHFYLCIYISAAEGSRDRTKGNFRSSAPMEWREGPQHRVYPILVPPAPENFTTT